MTQLSYFNIFIKKIESSIAWVWYNKEGTKMIDLFEGATIMKKKLIVPILIFAFLFNGCTNVALPGINNNSTINKPYILGSIEYVKNIQNIAKKSGDRSALSAIMIDVDKNGNDLDNNDPTNIIRFHKLVSSLIYKIGYVDMQTHYFRNKLNRVPKTLTELIRLNKTLPLNKRWKLLSIQNSMYHMQGVDGEYNLKFISCDGFCEAVYNKNGVLLDEKNDPINMGSYNYAAGISNINAHRIYDLSPYLKWGNTANSPEKGKDAINKGTNSASINYKNQAASVHIYRQNLFGMQQGRVP
jgi:hypothetical protein